MTAPIVITPMSKKAARKLTDRINTSMEDWCLLLVEAHDNGAWVALGYASWRDYAMAELDISQSQAYNRLSQGRVVLALSEAFSTKVEITEQAARDVAPHVDEVVESAKAKVAAGTEPAEAVKEAVKETRAKAKAAKPAKPRTKPAKPAAKEDVNPAAPDEKREDVEPKIDWAKEFLKEQKETERLEGVIESLGKTDTARELIAMHAKYAALDGRFFQMMEDAKSLEGKNTYMIGILQKIRKVLNVEKNGEILEAIQDLKR